MSRLPGSLLRRRTVSVVSAVALLAGAGTWAAVSLGASADASRLPVGAGYSTTLSFNPTASSTLTRTEYLALAEQGVAETQKWWDQKLHWYRASLGDDQQRPLESLWDTVAMFELLDEVAMAQPNDTNRSAVAAYAAYYSHYWNPSLEPAPGYAPYPGDRGKHQTTWYDDAGWLGLAFLDADRATGTTDYLVDAQRCFAFIDAGGWDVAQGGGMWWDTEHPWRSGEALAAGVDLAARLYQATGKTVYSKAAYTWIAWANTHLRQNNGVYIQTASTPYGSLTYRGSGYHPGGATQNISLPPGCKKAKSVATCVAKLCKSHKLSCPAKGGSFSIGPHRPANARPTMVAMPHDGEGAMLSAMVTLYQTTHDRAWLTEAQTFAGNIMKWLEPYDDGPQYDGIMLRGFVALYAEDHDPRWHHLVTAMASIILRTARTAPGVYLKPWGPGNGTRVPGAVPGMLRTDASSLMVFADLATVEAPK